jgi:hypothetical protein
MSMHRCHAIRIAGFTLVVLLAKVWPAVAQSPGAMASASGGGGFGYLWEGDQGIWLQADGRAVWAERGWSALYPRYFDAYEVHPDRVCLLRTHRVRDAAPRRVCLTVSGHRCVLSAQSFTLKRHCAATTERPRQWATFSYDRRSGKGRHCCGGPLPVASREGR